MKTRIKKSTVSRAIPLLTVILLIFAIIISALIHFLYNRAEYDDRLSVDIPILMYHSLTTNANEVTEYQILADTFESHIKALSESGYEAVLYRDIVTYVENGTKLPEKPIIITFDDGYRNNITLGAPILEKYGFSAEISVIGSLVGMVSSENIDIIPRFSINEAKSYIDKGVISIVSHSFDLHQEIILDGAGCRMGVLPLDAESYSEYEAIIKADTENFKKSIAPYTTNVFVYPYGKYNEVTEHIISSCGFDVTVTSDSGIAKLIKGDKTSLRTMPRLFITEIPSSELIEMIQ